MKKTLLIIFVFSIAINLFAQTSNKEQQLIGTWINDADGSTWIFNSIWINVWKYYLNGGKVNIY